MWQRKFTGLPPNKREFHGKIKAYNNKNRKDKYEPAKRSLS